jgi:hypothetical protein
MVGKFFVMAGGRRRGVALLWQRAIEEAGGGRRFSNARAEKEIHEGREEKLDHAASWRALSFAWVAVCTHPDLM